MTRGHALLWLAVGLGACAQQHAPADASNADVTGTPVGCEIEFGDPTRLPAGTHLSIGRHGVAGLGTWEDEAWVVTLDIAASEVWLLRLDAQGRSLATPALVVTQPLYGEAFVDLAMGPAGGLIVYNGCPDSGCEDLCPSAPCEMTPGYVARARAVFADGTLAPSDQRLPWPGVSANPQVASWAESGYLSVIDGAGVVPVSPSGEPAAAQVLDLSAAPIEGFALPGGEALFGLESAADGTARFVVLDGSGTPGPETVAGPFAGSVSEHVALAPDAQRIAFAAFHRLELVDRGGGRLASAELDETIVDLQFVSDVLFVLTLGTGPREGVLDLHVLDGADALARAELPHSGFAGLIATGAGALVIGRDEDGPLAYSVRCVP